MNEQLRDQHESAVTFLEEFRKHVKARDYDAALKLLRADPAEPERLRALLQRARQALRSLDEISDEELQRLADDLDTLP
jgi:DNA-directed RNA polymerase subunit F